MRLSQNLNLKKSVKKGLNYTYLRQNDNSNTSIRNIS